MGRFKRIRRALRNWARYGRAVAGTVAAAEEALADGELEVAEIFDMAQAAAEGLGKTELAAEIGALSEALEEIIDALPEELQDKLVVHV